ncbi:MAG: hypothetical protein ACRCWU_02250 [Metamycoplasmataceae bacterium]
MNKNTIKKNKYNNSSLLSLSIFGVILSLLAFGTFVSVLIGLIFIIMDSFQTFWVPILIVCSIVFILSCTINILIYGKVILNKNTYIKNDENEFPFWTSAFIFWLLPIFSWSVLIALYNKETKGLK